MMRENLLLCLDQMDNEFNATQFKRCLQNNLSKKITAKYVHSSLKSLEKKNHIRKTSKSSYKKLLPTKIDPLDITNEFIKKCREEKKVFFWQYGGMLSTAAQFIMLGISKHKTMPEWKEKFLKILLERHGEIYRAIEILLTYDHKTASLTSEASRQVLLELIPYWIGHKAGDDNDGLNAHDLLKEVSRLSGFIPHSNGRDEVSEYITIFEKSLEDHEKDHAYPKKIADKLVMITIPNDWTLDENYDKRELVRYMTKAVRRKFSTESILFWLTSYFWNQNMILNTLSELEYLSKAKIGEVMKYYHEFKFGRLVLPYLDDIDYCLKTINKLNSGKLKSGWYENAEYIDADFDDKSEKIENAYDQYLGKRKPESVYDPYEVKNNSELGTLRHRHMPFYEIKSKSYYENQLEKRVMKLREFVKANEIDKVVKAAGFTISYKLPEDSMYLWEEFEISKGLAIHGISIAEEQIQSSYQLGLEQGKRFIQKALKSKI
ncbi:MAG: hypothetical protein WAO91_00365 [Candidatus Nitrosotenuis sp.]